MSVTTLLFDVLAPVAVLVALGAAAGPKLDVDVATLSRMAYYVFGPAFVFAVLADAELQAFLVLRLVAAGLAGMLAAGAVALVWA
ncbi:MAG: AEC family transporter, partial [Acidimicrobiales bacterium]